MLVPVKPSKNLKPAKHVSDLLNEPDDILFLRLVYITFLDRDADTGGLEFYLNEMKSGVTRGNVVCQISSSKESKIRNIKIGGLGYLKVVHKIGKFFNVSDKKIINDSGGELKKDAVEMYHDHVCMRVIFSSNNEKKLSNILVDSKNNSPSVWFDLTTSLEWKGGVVGIIRAELEVAAGLKKTCENIRYVVCVGYGFVEVPHDELGWLFNTNNVAESYMEFFARQKDAISQPGFVHLRAPIDSGLCYPFQDGDLVIAMGWMDSQKEKFYSLVKSEIPGLYINYLIYDTIMLNDETRRFYSEQAQTLFSKYIRWISYNSDLILFGGVTAKNDTENIQKKNGWPVRPGLPIKFGTDIVKSVNFENENSVLSSLGVSGDFVITVGSLEPRKNHDTLYRAYLYAHNAGWDSFPQLVICGKPMWRTDDLLAFIDNDPRVKNKIIRLTPTDQELALLYKRCLFTLLPSLYEGWSLTLPESLGQGKFCLATDTPPLREIGKGLVEFVDGWDVKGWAEKIRYFSQESDELLKREKIIKERWPKSTWLAAAKMIIDGVQDYAADNPPRTVIPEPEVWVDLTTSYLSWQGGMNGIIRTELSIARNLISIVPNIRFFAYDAGNFFEIEKHNLDWLLNDLDLSNQYAEFHDRWKLLEDAGTAFRSPFALGAHPGQSEIIRAFPDGSVFVFMSIDFNVDQGLSKTERIIEIKESHKNILLTQLVCDLTPFVHPEFYDEEVRVSYQRFMEILFNKFDCLFFGSRSSLEDGQLIKRKFNWASPYCQSISYGTDMVTMSRPLDSDYDILRSLGVGDNFLISVGTIEPRKNHEMLYKSYLLLMQRGIRNLPKLVFVGSHGWKTDDFMAILCADDRVKDSIIIVNPSDVELDVLYRNCRFVLQPSFYEGGSLALFECMSHGKFSLVSDIPSFREIGKDYIEYINPLDTIAWVDRIAHYIINPDEAKIKEELIRENWLPNSWLESAREFYGLIISRYEAQFRKIKNG